MINTLKRKNKQNGLKDALFQQRITKIYNKESNGPLYLQDINI